MPALRTPTFDSRIAAPPKAGTGRLVPWAQYSSQAQNGGYIAAIDWAHICGVSAFVLQQATGERSEWRVDGKDPRSPKSMASSLAEEPPPREVLPSKSNYRAKRCWICSRRSSSVSMLSSGHCAGEVGTLHTLALRFQIWTNLGGMS